MEVDEDALGGFRTQEDLCLRVLRDALEGFEHHIKLTDAGELGCAAVGTGDPVFGDVGGEVLAVPAAHVKVVTVGGVVFDEFIGAVALLAGLTVDERIGEVADVAGRHPGLGVHEDGAIHPDVVGAFLHEFLPPCALDIVLELDAQGTVIPGVGEAAVDFGAGEDKAAVFTQGDEFLHG